MSVSRFADLPAVFLASLLVAVPASAGTIQLEAIVQSGDPVPDPPMPPAPAVFDFFALQGAPPTSSRDGLQLVFQADSGRGSDFSLYTHNRNNATHTRLTVDEFVEPGGRSAFRVNTPTDGPYPVNDFGRVGMLAGYVVDTNGNGMLDAGFEIDANTTGIVFSSAIAPAFTQVVVQQGVFRDEENKICDDGALQACLVDSECPGMACDPALLICDPKVCEIPSDCDPGEVCIAPRTLISPAPEDFDSFADSSAMPALAATGQSAFRAVTGMGPGIWKGSFAGDHALLARKGVISAGLGVYEDFGPPAIGVARKREGMDIPLVHVIVYAATDQVAGTPGSGLWRVLLDGVSDDVEELVVNGAPAPPVAANVNFAAVAPFSTPGFGATSTPGGVSLEGVTVFAAPLVGDVISCGVCNFGLGGSGGGCNSDAECQPGGTCIGFAPSENSGIYTVDTDESPIDPLERLVQTGQIIHVDNLAGGVDLCFDTLREPVINARGDIAFLGTARVLTLPGFNPNFPIDVLMRFVAPSPVPPVPPGDFEVVAALGFTLDLALPGPGIFLNGPSAYALNGSGDVAFRATDSNGVELIAIRPLFDTSHEVIRLGQPLTVQSSAAPPALVDGAVSAFELAVPVPRGGLALATGGVDGLPSPLADTGELVFTASVSACLGGANPGDPCWLNSQCMGGSCEIVGGGLFQARVPEPAAALQRLSALALLAILRRRSRTRSA